MLNKRLSKLLLIVGILVAFVAGAALAQLGPSKGRSSVTERTKEDISACKLPHGELVLPDRNTPVGSKGNFLRFSDRKFSKDPYASEGRQAPSLAVLFQRLRSEKVGDLFYSALNAGTLVAVSGRVRDLGSHYLYEFDGKTLTRPEPVEGTEERNAQGEGTPGAIEGIHAGHCYLLETVDGKAVLLRVVQIRPQERSALIQFVYQPDGTRVFEIPRGRIERVADASGATSGLSQPIPALPPQITNVYALLEVRDKMISSLMDIVSLPARNATEVRRKAAAIDVLGRLRASDAVPVLVAEIAFHNPNALRREITVEGSRPCVTALQQIGKPGSLAVLAAAKKVGVTQSPESYARSPWETEAGLQLYLYAVVLKNVEGPDVAEFMIKRQLVTATGAEKRALEAVHAIVTETLQ